LEPSLDITLVPATDQQAPDNADFLAQANQQGGGESAERAKPTTVLQADQRVAAQQPLVAPVQDTAKPALSADPDKTLLAANRQSTHQVATKQLKAKAEPQRHKLSAATLMRQSRELWSGWAP